MDSTKWVNGEIVVEVRNKQLVVNLELVGQMENIGLIFTDPDVIDAISADFNVLSRESDTLFTFGEIYGTYYNDGSEGSAPGSFLGDVVAVFALLDDVAAYAVWKCQSKNCETLEFLSIDPLTQLPGAALLSFVDSNVAHRPFVQWDGAVFTFQIDDKPPVVFDPVAAGAPIAGAPNFPVKYVGARAQLLSGESGAISLTIDNVRAGSAIDIPTE
ncbi:MAG: hypothetical protein IID61_18910 [SAR324 cluster bacterium]|nr:hypothetical protein [SAR324 cluster bacterium]